MAVMAPAATIVTPAIVATAVVDMRGRSPLSSDAIPAAEAAPAAAHGVATAEAAAAAKSAAANIAIVGKAASALARKTILPARAGSCETGIAGARVPTTGGTASGEASVARDTAAISGTTVTTCGS